MADWNNQRLLLFMEEIRLASERISAARRRRQTQFGEEPPAPVRSRFARDLEQRPRRRAAAAPVALPVVARPEVATTASVGQVAPAAGASSASLLAQGYHPAVVKVISYGHGRTRASAMASYLQREEVALETYDGRVLNTKEEATEEMRRWSASFENRRPSEDVTTFTVKLAGQGTSREDLRKAIAAGFDGHKHAYRIDEAKDGSLTARAVVSLAGTDEQRSAERYRLSSPDKDGEQKLSRKSEALIAERIARALAIDKTAVSLAVAPSGHGKNGVVYHFGRASQGGPLTTSDGKPIANPENMRDVARQWERTLKSFTPRDVMHMILSAKADTDHQALKDTARAFLQEKFPDNKFVFALHADKADQGHIHVHAVVAVKGENGYKLDPNKQTFADWRTAYAAHAQQHGLKIVASAAMQRASSQSYGPRDKAIVDVAAKPRSGREARDRNYARLNPQVVEKAQQRIDTARANPIKIPATMRQLAAVSASLAEHVAIPAPAQNTYATRMVERLTRSAEAGIVIQKLQLTAKDDSMAKSSEEMRDQLRVLNQQAGLAAASLSGESKKQFMQTTQATMNLLALRADLQNMKESGVTTLSPEEMRRMITPETAALLAKANQVASAEGVEAQRAEKVARQMIESERRREGNPGRDPENLKEVATARDSTRIAENIASRERREADQARLAADAVAAHKPIDPNSSVVDRVAELRRQQDAIDKREAQKAKPQKL